MIDPIIERYELYMRPGERDLHSVLALVAERFGPLEVLEQERPLSPAARLAAWPTYSTMTGG